MAQIHALTPEGRLPSAAVEHVREIVTGATWEVDIPLAADWDSSIGTDVTAYRDGNVVTVTAWRMSYRGDGTGPVLAYTLPPGVRPVSTLRDYTRDSRDTEVRLNGSSVEITDPDSPVSHHSFTFITLDPPPSQ